MATIGQLVVELAAETSKFRTDLERARRDVSSLGNEMTKSFSSMERSINSVFAPLRALTGVVAAAAGVGGLSMLITRSIDTADGIAKMASRTGLGIEALQELQHAARLSNVSMEAFETSVGRLQRQMVDAAAGNKEASSFFRDLGITVTDASGRLRSTDGVLNDLADRLKTTGSAAERTRIAMEGMGRGGTAMLPLLREGSEGLRAMREEARRLGVVLDTQTIKEAEKANDALTRMGTAIQTNLNRALLSVVPLILRMTPSVVELTGAVAQFLQTVMPAEMVGSDELTDRLARLNLQIAETKREITSNESFAPGWAAALRTTLKGLEEEHARINRLRNAARGLDRVMGDDSGAPSTPTKKPDPPDLKAWNASINEYIDAQFAGLKATQGIANDTEDANTKAADASLAAWVQGLNDNIDAQFEWLTSTKQITDQIQETREKAAIETSAAELAAFVQGLNDNIDVQYAGLQASRTVNDLLVEDQKRAADASKREWDSVANSISRAFDDSIRGVIQGTQTLGEAFDNMAQSIALSLIQNVVNRGIKAVSDALFDLVQQMAVFASIKAAVGLGTSAIGGTAGLGLSAGGGILMAEGGIATRPTRATIGEAGPEAVIPLDDLWDRMDRRGGGGVVVNVTNTVSGSEASSQERGGPNGERIIDVMVARSFRKQYGQGAFDKDLATTHGLARRGIQRG